MAMPRADMRTPRLWRWVQNLRIEKQHRLVIGGGIGCFLLLLLLAMVGERGFFEVYHFGRHLQHIESRIRELEKENERLWRQVTGLRSDPYQVEKLAREDLGLVRPDEIIFEIVDGGPEDSSWTRTLRKE
jgi:cell division protein FtsB